MMYLFNDIRSITVKRIKCIGKHGLISHSRSDLLCTQKLGNLLNILMRPKEQSDYDVNVLFLEMFRSLSQSCR